VSRFFDWCRTREVTHLSIPTAFFHELVLGLSRGGPVIPASLECVAFGGEAARPDLVSAWTDAAGSSVRIINAYGPTEATVVCVAADLTGSRPEGAVTIGRPVGTNRAHVLDLDGSPVPDGQEGELVISGVQVGRGYLGRDDLTTARFVPDPSNPDRRAYRTGDLVRRDPDGNLVYLGRLDRQVKVRGYRIELESVEAALRSSPDVVNGVVVARRTKGGDVRMIAYAVPAAPGDPEALSDRVLTHLFDSLPGFSVPDAVMPIPDIPLTVSGKIDERALPDPTIPARRYAPLPPGGAVDAAAEAVVARLFGEVLDLPEVGPDTGFFQHGGHSLLAMRLLSAIRQEFGVDLPFQALITHDTVRSLAGSIAASPPVPSVSGEEAVARRTGPVLSPDQERMWILHRLEPDSPAYLIPELTRLRGPVDVEALEAAVGAVAARHDVLRTRYRVDDGLPMIDPATAGLFEVEDSTGADPEALAERALAALRVPIDLARGPVWRVKLYVLGSDDRILATVLHHVAGDAESCSIVNRELAMVYAGEVSGLPIDLPPLEHRYAEHAERARQWPSSPDGLRGRERWTDLLRGVEDLHLRTDRTRPLAISGQGDIVPFAIGSPAGASLGRLARQTGSTPFMVGLAGFAAHLHRLTGAGDFCVGVPVSNRRWLPGREMVGLFVNSLPVPMRFRPNMAFRDVVAMVRAQVAAAMDLVDVPFGDIVSDNVPRRNPGSNPLFQVMFQYGVETSVQAIELPGVSATRLALRAGAGQVDYSVELEPDGGGLAGFADYSTDLFERRTVEEMVAEYVRLVGEMASDPDRLAAGAGTPSTRPDSPAPPLPVPPATANAVGLHPDIVAALVEEWSRVLSTEATPATDFLDAGGTSLQAVRLLSSIEARFGLAIPLSALYEHRTPAAVAGLLVAAGKVAGGESDAVVHSAPSVFPIADGPGPGLYCLNPGGGGLTLYQPLADRLSGRLGVFGVASRGWDGRSRTSRSIREAARDAADDILSHADGTPIRLLGYSHGGIKAFETARELERRGVAAEFVGLIDTFLPWAGASNRSSALVRQAYRMDGAREAMVELWNEIRSHLGHLRHAPLWNLYTAAGRPVPPHLAQRRLDHASDIAFRRYRYDGGGVSVPLTLFRAAGHDARHHPERRWRSATAAGLRVVDLPGRHSGDGAVVDEPHVANLADAVVASLEGEPS
jgi:non-ribosomal peptide synthetase component F/thioesterase domain-containing protein